MRHTKVNRDSNHATIVTGLINAGYSVIDLAMVGSGCPDILVGVKGNSGKQYNILMEIKSDVKASDRPDQIKFRQKWKGQQTVVFKLADALMICNHFQGL